MVETPSTCSMAVCTAAARSARGVVVYTLVTYCATHVCTSTPRTSDQFVLPQVDVRNGNRWQERLEHPSGADMVSCEERPAAQTQVFADVRRVGVSHDTRRFSE